MGTLVRYRPPVGFSPSPSFTPASSNPSPKFRNEIRPRFGLMRAREFIMMDAYSFDTTDDGAIKSYLAMKAAYESFFKRIGAHAIAVDRIHRQVGADV